MSVPMLFPNSTIVCIGGGPSLTREDVEFVRGKARVIVVNDGYRIAPWADVLHGCDHKFWKWQARDHREQIEAFTGLRYTMMPESRKWADVQVLKDTGETGLELDPSGLRTGRNGGYQAIGIAKHIGAKRIILLGYDMAVAPSGKEHWFGKHPEGGRSPYSSFRQLFPTIVKPLLKLGIEVFNCSRVSALDCFPKVALEQALAQREVAA